MDLWQVPPVDVLPELTHERADLLELLAALSAQEWLMATAVPGWNVKDLALHLLDDDLGWLSRERDADRTGHLDMSDHRSFVAALATKNQRWVDGARQLSRRVVLDLLRWAGEQMDANYALIDPMGQGWVSWAGDAAVPQWFDIAQDLTERWVHQLQMREAVGKVGAFRDTYLSRVLRTFVWAVPHQYRHPAPSGTVLALDLAQGGRWVLRSAGAGRWTLDEGSPAGEADLEVRFTDDGGWRWLTGALVPGDSLSWDGRSDLLPPLLAVRGIIV